MSCKGYKELNIEAFVNWPNWGVIIHSNPEELVGHCWASLGVEPLPQDLEVLEREKSQSDDVPVIGEGRQGVAKSIDKGKGKGIALTISPESSLIDVPHAYTAASHVHNASWAICNSHLGAFTFEVKATYLQSVPLKSSPSHTLYWPLHFGTQYIHGHPNHQSPTSLMKKEAT
ncbi:hypothetical protein EDC04DRAFT_2605640 [Pisolithus marmoratus]|nr:hypothetical protein EDC04DRAFT_2605640 [Pisolithus marmoratus]